MLSGELVALSLDLLPPHTLTTAHPPSPTSTMSNLPLPTTNLTEMVIDAVGQPVPASQAAFAQPDPAGSSQPPQPQYVPYQVPPSYPVAGPSHAPLHPMVQGRFPHTYTSPYGAPLPYAVVTHQLVPASSSSHQMVQYPPTLTSLSRTGPVALNAPPFLPPGMPPLMPIPGLLWAPVPNHHLLVAHTAGCTCGTTKRQ